jgi:hypothetical protein
VIEVWFKIREVLAPPPGSAAAAAADAAAATTPAAALEAPAAAGPRSGAAASAADDGGVDDGPGSLAALLGRPELLARLEDPRVRAAVQEVAAAPWKAIKYALDPPVRDTLKELAGMLKAAAPPKR